MQTFAGRYYRIDLEVSTSHAADSSWILGVLAHTYPQAEIVSLTESDDAASVVMRWRSGTGSIDPGEGLQSNLPGLVTDSTAHITRVTEIDAPLDVSTPKFSWSLVGALALVAAVAYLSSRVKT